MLVVGSHAIDERLFILGAAIVVHAILCSEAFLRHIPSFLRVDQWLHRYVEGYVVRMNKASRSEGKRRWRGSMLCMMVLVLSLISAVILTAMVTVAPYGWVAELVVVALFMRWRPMDDLAEQHAQEIDAASEHLELYSPYSTDHMDRHGRFRHVIELMGQGFSERLIGGSLVYMIGGLPLLWLHGACCILYIHAGQHKSAREPFGMAARSLYWFMQAIPSILAALLLRAGRPFAPKLEGKPPKSFACEAYHWHRLMLASLLAIQLGGKQRMGGQLLEQAWMGEGTAKVRRHHVRQAQRLVRAASLLWCLLLLVATTALLGAP